jgi:ribosome-associated translation inhibitor RaiA
MTSEDQSIREESTPFVVVTKGRVSDADVEHAIRRLTPVLDKTGAPVLMARLNLEQKTNPARERPAVAKATIDVQGDLIRAHIAAETMRQAVDLVRERLRDQLDHRSERRRSVRERGAAAAPGSWRRGDVPTTRPEYFDRPVDERELVRRKSFSFGEMTPEEAAFDMEMMDHDFFLFVDLESGTDALVERTGDEYRLTTLRPIEADAPTGFDFSEMQPTRLTVEEAAQRLDATGEPRVFFENSNTGRGNVVYMRYDGHYGLIEPS